MMSRTTSLTPEQALDAMRLFLEGYYSRTKSDDIAMVLSDIVWAGKKMTVDPAAWHDWIKCVNTAAPNK